MVGFDRITSIMDNCVLTRRFYFGAKLDILITIIIINSSKTYIRLIMTQAESIKFFHEHTGLLRTKEILSAGIGPKTLYKLRDEGIIEQVSYGLYRSCESPISEYSSYLELTRRIPNAVFCLISALDFLSIGTQLPYEHWITLPTGTKEPRINEYSLQFIHATDKLYQLGIEEHVIDQVTLRFYSPAKTVVDCFKHRSKVGLEVAIEALKESIKLKKATRKKILEYATQCRMKNVMMPYLESL